MYNFVFYEKTILIQIKNLRNNMFGLFKKIIPKLQEALRNCLKSEHNGISLFVKTQKWENLLIHKHYVNLIQRFFFPKWIYLLRKWINKKNNYNSLKRWYLGWKNAFSQAIRLNPIVQESLAIALDMFNWSLNNNGLLPDLDIIISTLNFSSIVNDCLEKQSRKKAFLINKNKQTNYCFLDIIQAYAERNSCKFIREFMINKGNQLEKKNEIYCFGSIYCYFDKEIVWAKINKKYKPVNLRELLALAKGKKNREQT